MKKNVLQLLGIAFVVAIAATGIFYGLLAGQLRSGDTSPRHTVVVASRDLTPGVVLAEKDLRLGPWAGQQLPQGTFADPEPAKGMTVVAFIHAGEPVTLQRVASRDGGSGAALGIPAGMRAASVRVSEPAGVVAMLRRGHRVDVQVVYSRGEPSVRTLLQNVQVLDNSQASAQATRPAPVVTLLVTPAQANLLALADSAASIRLVLRNPVDESTAGSGSIGVAALLRESGVPASPTVVPTAAAERRLVRLRVQIAAAGRDPRAAAVRAETLVSGRQPDPGLEILDSSDHQIAAHRTGSVRRSAGGYVMRIQLAPDFNDRGRLRLRVGSEMVQPENRGYATRRHDVEAELTHGQKLLVTGLAEAAGEALLDRLFKGRVGKRDLVVIITPEWSETVALGAPAAGRLR